MITEAPAPVHVLSFQRDYRCRHSGACCSAGWHIPVEPRIHALLALAQREGRFRPPGRGPDDGGDTWIDARNPPEGAVGVLTTRADGTCACFDPGAGNLCAIHRQLGRDALPSACQQFPRVTLIDDRGAHVTLSHYCPTVAALLARADDSPVDIVRLRDDDDLLRRPIEGFDARGAVPPFLRPGVAFDLPSYDLWERGVVLALGRGPGDADIRLAGVAEAAERLRGWRPARGPLVEEVGLVLGAPAGDARADTGSPDHVVMGQLYDAVVASVPDGLPAPSCPSGWATADRQFVAPAWTALSMPIGRFLAAKAFAAQVAWQAEGVRTQVVAIAAARAVLRVETARRAAAAGRICDQTMLVEGARAADALLEHLSDRLALVRRWAPVETLSRRAFLSGLGVGVTP